MMYNCNQMKSKSGFTIVELLIVIVVIAILASTTVVAFGNMRAKANDAIRVQHFTTIQKALLSYKAVNGDFPQHVDNTPYGSMEVSNGSGFLASVSAYSSGITKLADPQWNPSAPNDEPLFFYEKFPAGSFGCPAALGNYYVISHYKMETQTDKVIITNGCTGQTMFSPTATPGTSSVRHRHVFGFQNG